MRKLSLATIATICALSTAHAQPVTGIGGLQRVAHDSTMTGDGTGPHPLSVVASTTGLTGTLTTSAIPKANGPHILVDSLVSDNGAQLTYNTSKFTVQAASGNTVVAGTLSVGGNTQIGGTAAATLGVVDLAGSGIDTSLNGGAGGAAYVVHGGSNWGLVVERATADTGGPNIMLYKTRSTNASTKTAVAANDQLGRIFFDGATDGTTAAHGAAIVAQVQGTVSTGIIPGELFLQTTNTSGVTTTALTLFDDQSGTFAAGLTADATHRVFDIAGTGLTSSTNTVSLSINGGVTQTATAGQAFTSMTSAGVMSSSVFVNAAGSGLLLTGSSLSLNINSGSTQTCGAGTAVTAVTALGVTSCTAFGGSSLTNGAGNNVITKSNGTNLVASAETDDATTFAVNVNKFTVVEASGNTNVAGTFGVTGATTLSSTLGVTGATTLSSTLGVTGAAILSSTLEVDGATTTLVNGGTVTRLDVKNSGSGGREWFIDSNATAGGSPNALSIYDQTGGTYRAVIKATAMTLNNASSDTLTLHGATTADNTLAVTNGITADTGLRVFDIAGTGLASSTNTVSLSINGGVAQSCAGGSGVTGISATGIETCTTIATLGAASGTGTTGTMPVWTNTTGALGNSDITDNTSTHAVAIVGSGAFTVSGTAGVTGLITGNGNALLSSSNPILSLNETGVSLPVIRFQKAAASKWSIQTPADFSELEIWDQNATTIRQKWLATSTVINSLSTDTLTLHGATSIDSTLNMNSNKITSCANGTVFSDGACFGQIATGVNAAVSGTTNTIPIYTGTNTLGNSLITFGSSAYSTSQAWNGGLVESTTADSTIPAFRSLRHATAPGTPGTDHQYGFGMDSDGTENFNWYYFNGTSWSSPLLKITTGGALTASSTAHIVGDLTEDGSVTLGDASGDSVVIKAGFTRLNATGDDPYFSANTLNAGYSVNALDVLYLNYFGFNAGATQFRDTFIGNGKNAPAMYITGSTKGVEFNGALLADSTAHIVGAETLDGALDFDSVTNGSSIEVINGVGFSGGTTQFRSIQIDNGKGAQFALFDGTKSSLEVDGNIAAGATAATVFIGDNGVSCLWNTNASGSCEFNNVGFSNGQTQFRNFRVRDGKGTQAFFINASNATQYIEADYGVTGSGGFGVKGAQLSVPEGITGDNGYGGHHLEWNDDWANVFQSTTAPTAQYIGTQYQIQSSGASESIASVAGVTSRPGVVALAKNGASVVTDYTAIVSDPNGVNYGDGDWSYQWVGGISATSSNGSAIASAYIAEMGFLDSPSVVDQVDGCYFVYDHPNIIAGGQNAGNTDNLEAVCSNNSTRTIYLLNGVGTCDAAFAKGTVTAAAVTFPNTNILNLKVKMDGSTTAHFFSSGTEVCRITTNIPSGSARLTGFGYLIHNEATTGTGDKELYTDFTSAQVDLTTARSP